MVSNTPGMRGTITVADTACGIANITASYQGITSNTAVVWTECPTLISRLEVAGASTTLCAGHSLQLVATAVYTDMRTADVSAMADWTSSAPAVATVGPFSGRVDAVSAGSVTITGSIPDGGLARTRVTGTLALTVLAPEPVSMVLSPGTITLAPNGTVRLAARTTDACGDTSVASAATYTSADPSIAYVDSAGVVLGLAPGSTTISADAYGLHAESMVTVTAP
jgi:uncharacterized protein YjdB